MKKTIKASMATVIVFILVAISVSSNIFAANFQEKWSVQHGGSGNDFITAMQQTSDGGYIAAGYTNGDVGSTTNLGGNDGWIIKTASDGSVEWSKQYGGSSFDTFQAIQQTNDGGYIAAGRLTAGGTSGNDGWLLKIASDGTEEWSKVYGFSTGYDNVYSVQQTSDGGYIVGGYIQNVTDDAWIFKVTSDGTEEWSKQYGGSGSEIFWSIQQTSDGGYIAGGRTNGSVGSTTNLGGTDGWILKVASDGVEEWSKQYGSSVNDSIYSIQQPNDGGYIVAGSTDGSVGSTTNLGGTDGWILKVANDGTEEWSRQHGSSNSDTLRSIKQTNDGGYITAGYTSGSVGSTTNLGSNDGWALKIANDGMEEWSKQYGSSSSDNFYAIQQTSDGAYTAAGNTAGSVGGATNLGGTDGWIINLSEEFTLSFDLNGASGTAPDNQGLFAGNTATTPVEPIRDGYTFIGWNTEANGSGNTWDFDVTTMPADHVTLYAQWEEVIIEYTLQFNLNGGQGTTPINQVLQEGQKAEQPIDPTKDGYVFKEWNTEADGSGNAWDFDVTTMPANNVTLHAQWEEILTPIPPITPVNPGNPGESGGVISPKTGDSTNVIGLSFLLLGSIIMMVRMGKKRRFMI